MVTRAKFVPAEAPAAVARPRRTVAAAANDTAPASTDLVPVMVPKGFMLTDDNHQTHKYSAGPQRMRRDHAEHWYSKANGVTLDA